MSSDFKEVKENLSSPMPYQWRVKTFYPKGKAGSLPDGTKGQFLAYIDARDVYDRLDAVVGPDNWQDKLGEGYPDGSVGVSIGIKIGEEWVWKSDVGYPNSDQDEELMKSAASDAIKRAAVHWGIGRFLYALDPIWVEVDRWGKPLKPITQGRATVPATAAPAQAGQSVRPATSAPARPAPAPRSAPPAAEDDHECEIVGCSNVVEGRWVAKSKRDHNGRVLCWTHSKEAATGGGEREKEGYDRPSIQDEADEWDSLMMREGLA